MITRFFTFMMNTLKSLTSKMRRKKIEREYDVWDAVNPLVMYFINKPYSTYVDFEEV